jgi:hypothetical protein
MKAYITVASMMAALSIVIPLAVQPVEARAVKYSVSENLQEVGSNIDQAVAQGTLSTQKADQLRTEQSKITKEQMQLKAQRGGSLTYSDIDYFESELMDLTNKIGAQR